MHWSNKLYSFSIEVTNNSCLLFILVTLESSKLMSSAKQIVYASVTRDC